MRAAFSSSKFGMKHSINKNLADIIDLHEEILCELHRIVPYSEDLHGEGHLQETEQKATILYNETKTDAKWDILNDVNEVVEQRTRPEHVLGVTVEPHVVAEVSKMFERKVGVG